MICEMVVMTMIYIMMMVIMTMTMKVTMLKISLLSESTSFSSVGSDSTTPSLPTTVTRPSYQLEMVDDFASFPDQLLKFTVRINNARVLSAVEMLIAIHMRCLDSMIALAFNMARGTIRVPARIKFARKKEVCCVCCCCCCCVFYSCCCSLLSCGNNQRLILFCLLLIIFS